MTGTELRQRREWLGLTQAELATDLGISANTVARWERDELRIGNPKLIALALQGLRTAGLRRKLADCARKLPRLNIPELDSAGRQRISVAASRLAVWLNNVLAMNDDDLRRTVGSRAAFPGYSALNRMTNARHLSSTGRSEIAWATISVNKALELAARLWSVDWLDISRTSTARRKRSL